MNLSRNLFRTALASLLVTTLASCGGTAKLRTSGSLGEAKLSTSAIDFGWAPCGGDAPEKQTITVTNDGDGPLRWSASIDSNTTFDLEGARTGTLESGESATLTVIAQGVSSLATAGDILKANIVVTTDDDSHPEVFIPVTVGAQGASLELVAPNEADFGEVPMGLPAPAIPLTLKNNGNVPVKVSVASVADPAFGFTWDGGPDPVEVAAGATMAGLAAQFTPKSTTKITGAGEIKVDGPVCGGGSTTIPTRGAGLGGVVGYSPGTLDLGKVGCSTQAPTQIVTIYNSGNLVFTWSAKFKDGSGFTLKQAGGAVGPGGSFQIEVLPKKLPMTTNLADNGFGDTLVIETSIPGDLPHEIPVKQTAAGGILKWSATPLTFGTQTVFTASAGKLVPITNDGNIAVKVKIAGTGQFNGSEGSAAANGGVYVSTVTYTPNDLGTEKGTFQIVTSDPVCAPLPGAVEATGTGKGAASAISVGGQFRRGELGSHGGCVILANSGGRVACFGSNEHGQLGGKTGTSGPTVVKDLKDVVSVASGGDFNCAADKAGAVWCWGNNRTRNNQQVGKLGSIGVDSLPVPTQVGGITDAVQVSIGHNIACARHAGGNVSCWGSNRRGKLGTGNQGDHNTPPTQVVGVAGAVEIAAGGGGGCARMNDGTVMCWGNYGRGNLGTCCGPAAMQVQNMFDAVTIGAFTSGSRSGPRCAVRMGGQLSCWGDPARGQLGIGFDTRGDFQNPQNVQISGTAVAVAGMRAAGCALMQDKTIQCWGRGEDGQIGDGTNFQHNSPAQVTGIADATALAAGGRAACAIVSGGSVKCWGNFGAGSSNVPQTLKYF